MSGGFFDYRQTALESIANDLEIAIQTNIGDNTENEPMYHLNFNPETISIMEKALVNIRRVKEEIDLIDKLCEGDIGEDTFIERWTDLK